MYLPTHFEGERAQAAALMREHPFASLISVDEAGLPFITHLPLHLEVESDEVSPQHAFTLLGHVAKGNPHWRFLQSRPQAVVTFLGPHAYLSPQVYPDLVRVPTWNYLAVHCTVQATLLDEQAAKDKLLKKLIADHEPAYATQWQSMDDSYARKMLAGIVAFELRVSNFQCKLKLNQHRPEAVVATLELYEKGSDAEKSLGRWLRSVAGDSTNQRKV